MNLRKNRTSAPRYSLFLILSLGGLFIGFLAALLLPQPFTGNVFELLIVSLVMFLWGGAGLIVFMRRELRQFGTHIKGKMAMMYGIFIMSTCWPLALVALINALRKLFQMFKY